MEEEVFDLTGLEVLPPGATEVASYSAGQMFVQRARRIQPQFAPLLTSRKRLFGLGLLHQASEDRDGGSTLFKQV